MVVYKEVPEHLHNPMWKRILRSILRLLFWSVVIFVVSSVVLVFIYKFVPPVLTPLMVIRSIEGVFNGKTVGITKSWVPYEDISKNIKKAVIFSEDKRFLQHDGFDWKAIEAAKRYNERMKGKRVLGASTITMQTSKNVFLWHGRNYIRKGLEAYFTVLIEAVWGKERILEVYLNIIEWGDGIYGIEAASEYYFKKSAKNLTAKEAGALAAIVPNPRKWSASNPTKYIKKRTSLISSQLGGIKIP
jgi:monofunctional biosynthetic peptidoglycan transglycosylase